MKPDKLLSMKKTLLALCCGVVYVHACAFDWKGSWISASDCNDQPNTWLDFQKEFELEKAPAHAMARIAADSKYWLNVNGQLVVFEGSLKRGPNPNDTYYDSVDIAPWLTPGVNNISVSVCYFGRDGFSHKSSGHAGLLFDCLQTTERKSSAMTPGRAVLINAIWSVATLLPTIVFQRRAYSLTPVIKEKTRIQE